MSKHIPEMPIKDYMRYLVANTRLQIEKNDVAIPYLVGSPGIGKSQFISEICDKNKFGFLSIHFALMPIEEIGGIPLYKKIAFGGEEVTGTEWSLPEIITKLYEVSENHELVILLLDDFHMCSPAHISYGYEMFTERKIRNFKIPDNVAFVLAGNDSSKSGSKQMFGAIINRISKHKVIPNFDQWVEDYAIPKGVNQKVISFLKSAVNRSFFLEEEDTVSPWASPRAWSRFSNMLNSMEMYIPNLNMQDILYIGHGHVGGNAISEFMAYYEIYSKSEMDKIFEGKKAIQIPSNNTDCYVYAMAASNEYVNLMLDDKREMGKIVDIISKIAVEISRNNVEIGIAMLKNIVDYQKSLSTSMDKKVNLRLDKVFDGIKKLDPKIDNAISDSLMEIVQAIN